MGRFTQFFSELRRRNVLRAGAAYLVLAWVIVQVSDIVLATFSAPPWIMRFIMVAVVIGLPVVLVLAWVYEITTSGVKRTENVAVGESITELTGRKLDFIVIGILVVAVAMFTADKFLDVGYRSGEIDDKTLTKASLAILPFSLESSGVQLYFGQLSADLTRQLRRSSRLKLASFDALEALPASTNITDYVSNLGVRYVLAGALRLVGDDLRLAVTLTDSDDDTDDFHKEYSDADMPGTNGIVANDILSFLNLDLLKLSESPPDPLAYETYLRGQLLASLDTRTKEGEQLYLDAIRLDSRFSLPHAGLCEVYIRRFEDLGDTSIFEDAERHCHRALTLDTHSAEVQYALGDLYYASGQMDKARDSYNASLTINSSYLKAAVGLAWTYFDNAPDVAEVQLKGTLREHPGSPNVHHTLFMLYWQTNRYSEAIEQARLTVRLSPNLERSKLNLAAVLFEAGNFNDAKSIYEEMVEQGSDLGGVYQDLGTILYMEGHFERAEYLYREGIRRSPQVHFYYRNLGDAIWQTEGRVASMTVFEKAIELAETALDINRDDIFALGTLVVSYASQGDLEKFDSTKAQLLKVETTDWSVYYDIAVSYVRLGNLEDAQIYIDKARTLGNSEVFLDTDPDIALANVTLN